MHTFLAVIIKCIFVIVECVVAGNKSLIALFSKASVFQSPLNAVIIEGGLSTIGRGYGQALTLSPADLSVDPDDPSNKVTSVWVEQDTKPKNYT